MSDIYSNIDPIILEKYSNIIGKLKNSNSINQDEKEYWVSSLNIMNQEQIQSLNDILDQEIEDRKILLNTTISKTEIEILDKQNQEKYEKIRQRKENRIKNEKDSEKDEQNKEEQLLQMLNEI